MAFINNTRGIALVQVMVMSLVLILFATGVLQVIFGTHVLYSRTRDSAYDKLWSDACMAQKNFEWSKTSNADSKPCNGNEKDSCDFCSTGGPLIEIDCPDPTGGNPAQAKYRVRACL